MLKKDYDKLKKQRKQQRAIQQQLLDNAINKCDVAADNSTQIMKECQDDVFLISLISFVLICGIIVLI